MRAPVVVQYHAIWLPGGRPQLRVLSVSGAVRQRRAPDLATDDARENRGRRRAAEGGAATGAGKGADVNTKARETKDAETPAIATTKTEEMKNAVTTEHAARPTKLPGTEASARRKGVANATEESAEGEGARGDVPGYVPTPEDLRLQEVYGDWVHGNPGTHLDGGVAEDGLWQGWWRDLAVMLSR